MKKDLTKMIVAIRDHGREFITGSNPVEEIAQEWIDAGFRASEVTEWWEAGCFDADRTATLRDNAVRPDEISDIVEDDATSTSVGYAFCNGDITLQDVITVCADN